MLCLCPPLLTWWTLTNNNDLDLSLSPLQGAVKVVGDALLLSKADATSALVHFARQRQLFRVWMAMSGYDDEVLQFLCRKVRAGVKTESSCSSWAGRSILLALFLARTRSLGLAGSL